MLGKSRAEALRVFWTLAGRGRRPPILQPGIVFKDHRNLHVHHHGRDGSGDDTNFLKATPASQI
jgi:hypothetical protein